MRLSDKLHKKYMGKYAIHHAGLLVIPQRDGERRPFDTKQEAENWARRNYRGADWKAIKFWPSSARKQAE